MASRPEERDVIVAQFQSVFFFDGERGGEIARGLEEGCWRRAAGEEPLSQRWMEVYSCTAHHILSALDPFLPGGMDLQNRLLAGEVNATDLASMTIDQMVPQANEEIRNGIALRNNQSIQKKICTMYTCNKCKESKTDGGREQQQRSGDEGATLKITCLVCGNKWSLN